MATIRQFKSAIPLFSAGVHASPPVCSRWSDSSTHEGSSRTFSSARITFLALRIRSRFCSQRGHAGLFEGAERSTSTVGSWNADNRSASLNSENTLVVYDEGFTNEVRAMILEDMAPEVAVELHYEDIAELPFDEETRNATVSLLSDFL